MTPPALLRSTGAALLLVAALTGCGGDDQPAAVSTVPGATGATTDKVNVKDFTFDPGSTTVKAGTTVTWTFNDDANHNVEPEGGTEPKASPDLQGGKTYTYTFETAGTFAYRCGIHNSMTGSVVVIA
jgi:plastocyanin